MEYLSLGKSGLFTILIPLNFLINEYTLYLKLCGKSRKLIHGIMLGIVLILTIFWAYIGDHPYYMFILAGGTIVGILQSEFSHRNEGAISGLNEVDRFLKRLRIMTGCLILPFTFFVRFHWPAIFLDLPVNDRYLAYGILGVLSFEVICFNCSLLLKYR